MKKRVLSVLLVIALLVAVGIIAAQADTTYTPEQIITLSEKQVTDQVFAGSDPVQAPCYACGGEVKEWKPISAYVHAQGYGHYLSADGHYFLDTDASHPMADADIIMYNANGGGSICIHMNGKTVTNTTNACILYHAGNTTLNVMGGGKITNNGQNGALAVNAATAVVNVYGTTMENVSNHKYAAAVSKGTATLYGVNASNSVVYSAGGTTNIVSGNIAKLTVYNSATAINISGAPTIGTVDFTDAGTVRPTYGVLEDGASIGFGSYNGVISAAYASPEEAADAAAAFPVKAGLMLTVTGNNELSLGPKVYTPATTVEEIISKSYLQSFEGSEPVADYCYACNQNVTWQPISAYTHANGAGHYLADGHYFVDVDLAASADGIITLSGGSTVTCLHLNGHTVENTGAVYPAVLFWSGNGTFNVMGRGTLKGSGSWGALALMSSAKTLNVYGCKIESGNKAVNIEKGILNLYDANASGNVYTAGGTTNIYSGSYKTLLAGSGAVNINGAPTIDTVDFTNAGTVRPTYGVLENGASIGFGSYQGVISSAYNTPAEAQAAAAAFPVAAGAEVIVNADNTLSVKNKVYTPEEIATESAKQVFQGTEPVKAFCYACGTNVTWEPVTGTTYKGGNGHYFVADSYTTTSDHGFYTWGAAGTICLHLNGKTITAQGGTLAAVSSYADQITLNVMGGGTLISGATNFGALYCHTGTATNVYGVNLINNGGNNRSVYVEKSGAANLYNVTASGNVYAPKGSIKIASGSCGKLIVGADATAATLSGAPTIGALDISAATVMLDLTGVTGGRINIGETEGVFTTEFEDADKAAAVAAFVASDTKAIVVDGKKLSATEAKVAVVAANGQKAYANYAEAEAAYTDGYIKMFVDNDIVVTKNVTIDLNGQHIDASGTGTLTLMDSKTYKDYAAVPGSIVVTEGNIIIVAPAAQTAQDDTVSGYLTVETQGIVTATYYEMKLSGVALRANTQTVGLYYKGTWSFNANLPAGKVEAGVVVNVKDQNDAPITTVTGNTANGYFSKDAKGVTNGEPMTSILVDDIMKSTDREPAKNSQYGQMKIKAAAFVIVNGQEILTATKNLSVCDVLKLIEGDAEEYAANETKLANFYNTWKDLANLGAWGFTKIGVAA